MLPEVPEEIERLVAERTGIEWTAYKNRKVVGTSDNGIAGGTGKHAGQEKSYGFASEYDITTPATPEAQQWQGWGTALKPAHEPIVVARKPLISTVANNVLTYGTGALNIDGSRVGTTDVLGRWPANVIHDGSDEVLAGFPNANHKTGSAFQNAGNLYGQTNQPIGYSDSGSAARFFYCAKASKSERNAGLEGLPESTTDIGDESPSGGSWERRDGRTSAKTQNFHPTVKPLALMRYLIKLVTPPGGIVLDPFLGSGTTAVAATLEGFDWIGCEMTEDYWPIIEARVKWAQNERTTTLF
jgi:site-specific DNA-methyltransferase (adenine-specific)